MPALTHIHEEAVQNYNPIPCTGRGKKIVVTIKLLHYADF